MMMVILPTLANQADQCETTSELIQLLAPFRSSTYSDKTLAAKHFAAANNIQY
jgi:hypothetical protein